MPGTPTALLEAILARKISGFFGPMHRAHLAATKAVFEGLVRALLLPVEIQIPSDEAVRGCELFNY